MSILILLLIPVQIMTSLLPTFPWSCRQADSLLYFPS